LIQATKLAINIATGQIEDGAPTAEEQGKEPAAVKRGRLPPPESPLSMIKKAACPSHTANERRSRRLSSRGRLGFWG
jgi:hypothetical protein